MLEPTEVNTRQSRRLLRYLSVTDETPNDLWMEIAALLEPLDICSLQTTCRALNQALYRKPVWAVALRQVCREHCLFLPTFPIDEMDTHQLFRAAMGPYRFNSLIEGTGPFAGHADDAPTLSPAHGPFTMSIVIGASSEWGTTYLVPGGRFFLTFDCKVLALWDLGFVGSVKSVSGPEPRRMAYVDFTPGNFVVFEDGKGFMAVSMYQDSLRVVLFGGSGRITLEAFEISHFSETGASTFRHLGELAG
ncbi:hypothetical protein DFP72DRAFT_556430 [Ephemerocybe angulata]|uniref:F-box domain-containing protein n=1 Tax=Ephemerocybe angulata TaxID=980116 RepID=A0A8H6HL51_9AGAR|nr:hypothetical protein DFP72DRAFT_556430 [Tulosesus angulatus]